MSWDRTYTHTALIAIDQFAAAIIFNRPDLTISSMCWLVQHGRGAELKLWPWQLCLLVRIGRGLEYVKAGHCTSAAQGDRDRADSALQILKVLS